MLLCSETDSLLRKKKTHTEKKNKKNPQLKPTPRGPMLEQGLKKLENFRSTTVFVRKIITQL